MGRRLGSRGVLGRLSGSMETGEDLHPQEGLGDVGGGGS